MQDPVYIAIDTAYEHGMVVLFSESQLFLQVDLLVKFDHGKEICGAIAQAVNYCALHKLSLSGFFCGLGPGSFVGVRIALATALGFCTAADLPLMGFCSHRALVRSKKPSAIFMKASGDLGYLTSFCVSGDQVNMSTASQLVALSDLSSFVENIEVFSDQAEKIEFLKAQKIIGPTALGIFEASLEKLPVLDQKSFIKPNYVKPPSVTLPKNLVEVLVVPRA